MKTTNVDSIQNGQYQSSDHVIHHPTFREIYESINYRDDLNGPQLFYLSRMVDRKLKSLDPRFHPDDFVGKPYRASNKTYPEEQIKLKKRVFR